MAGYGRILVDGRNVLFRCGWGQRNRSTLVDGLEVPTGALYGTLQMLIGLRTVHRAPVEVCWEGRSNWRLAEFPAYKAGRDKAKPTIVAAGYTLRDAVNYQEVALRELLRSTSVRQWEPTDGEADDALAARASAIPDHVLVVSGDGDLLQVVDDRVHVLPMGEHVWGPRDVMHDNRGLDGSFVPDIKGLMGDRGDNLPGCPGIGKVKALGLLAAQRWRVEQLLERVDAGLVPGAIGDKLQANAPAIRMTKRLATLNRSVELREEIGQRDVARVEELVRLYGLDELLRMGRSRAIAYLGERFG